MDLSQLGKFYLIAKKWDDFAKGIRSDDVTSEEVDDIKRYISNSTGVKVRMIRVSGEMIGPGCYQNGDYFPTWYDIYIVPLGSDHSRYHIGIGRQDTIIDRFGDDGDHIQCPVNLSTTDCEQLSA